MELLVEVIGECRWEERRREFKVEGAAVAIVEYIAVLGINDVLRDWW